MKVVAPQFVQLVFATKLRLLRRRSAYRPRGWGRLWPPRLALEVAYVAADGGHVGLTPLQASRLCAMAEALGYRGALFVGCVECEVVA